MNKDILKEYPMLEEEEFLENASEFFIFFETIDEFRTDNKIRSSEMYV